jgi:hypothetical protein
MIGESKYTDFDFNPNGNFVLTMFDNDGIEPRRDTRSIVAERIARLHVLERMNIGADTPEDYQSPPDNGEFAQLDPNPGKGGGGFQSPLLTV